MAKHTTAKMRRKLTITLPLKTLLMLEAHCLTLRIDISSLSRVFIEQGCQAMTAALNDDQEVTDLPIEPIPEIEYPRGWGRR